MKKIKVHLYVSDVIYKDAKGKILNEKEVKFLEDENIDFTEELINSTKETFLIWDKDFPPVFAYRSTHFKTNEPLTVVQGLKESIEQSVDFYITETPEEFYELLSNV
jgi:hypothetical protein